MAVLGRGHAPDLVREREKGIGASGESDGDRAPSPVTALEGEGGDRGGSGVGSRVWLRGVA